MRIDIDWYFIKDDEKIFAPIELLGIEPIPALKFYADNQASDLRRCPAHIDALKNTYVVCSPIDYHIEFSRSTGSIGVVEPEGAPQAILVPRFGEEGNSPYPVFSLTFGRMLFISRGQDVWIEQIDPFLEWERKNKMRVVAGTYNIGRWVRPIEFAFEQQEKDMTVRIRRGDPLCYVRFSTRDPADIVALNRIEQNPEDAADMHRNSNLKMFLKNKPLEFLYGLRDSFTKQRSKP